MKLDEKMISIMKISNKLTFIILIITVIFFSCKTETSISEEKDNIDKSRKKELTENANKYFLEKYNPIYSLDTVYFRHTYGYKEIFNDTTNYKLVLFKDDIDDFDLSLDGQYYFRTSDSETDLAKNYLLTGIFLHIKPLL